MKFEVIDPDRNTRILDLYDQGFTYEEIARLLTNQAQKVTRGAVGGVIYRAGRNKRLPAEQRKAGQDRCGQSYSPEFRWEVVDYSIIASPEEAADEYGCSVRTVYQWRKEMGVARR